MACLQRHVCFEALEPSLLQEIAAQAISRPFGAGELLLLEGDETPGLWLIESGRVKVFKLSPDGREQILHFFGPSDTFNEASLFRDHANPANAAALTPGLAWVVPAAAVRAVIAHSPDAAFAMLDVLSQRLRMLTQQIEEMAFYPVTVRLARFLMDESEGSVRPYTDITRTDIAARLAATPETISRALRSLQEMGAIALERQQIVVVRGDTLQIIAGLYP
ncbi:MAG: Crp/Fnr family transcriptional regulator [Anaerolineae bacterium]